MFKRSLQNDSAMKQPTKMPSGWTDNRERRHENREERASALRNRFAAVSKKAGLKAPRRSSNRSRMVFLWGLVFCLVAALGYYHFSAQTGAVTGGQTAFASCRQAAAAGIGPMTRSHPAYRWWLDADQDGIACEWN